MSGDSVSKTMLRQQFDAFIAANTHKKASETDFRRKGSLGVGLVITDTLMSKPQSFPLNPDDFLTDTGAAGTSASPQASPGTALSTARLSLDSNVIWTTYTPTPPPTGSAVQNDGNNVIDASAGSYTIVEANGQLNPAYSGYASLIGQRGYQIQ